MNLRDYLHFKRITAADFAKKIGVSANYIRMIANGRKIPGLFLSKAIEEGTNGEVKKEEIN